MVDSWPESLKIDSSRRDVCSGDVPCFAGITARSSFSTWSRRHSISNLSVKWKGGGASSATTYRDLEIHKFICEGAHLVIEAE